MTIIELRNQVIRLLSLYLGIPVIMADQTDPEREYPYIVYNLLTPYSSAQRFGDHHWTPEDDRVLDIRTGHAQASMSFTVCSDSDDEAQNYADQAVGWFLHTGYGSLTKAGIVVGDVLDVGNRSFIKIDEAARQYGFDVVLRYTRTDVWTTETVASIHTKRKRGVKTKCQKT